MISFEVKGMSCGHCVKAVTEALRTSGNGCLPLVLVDGTIVTRSIYPTRDQLALLAGLGSENSCCGGGETEGSSCCP